MCEDLHPAPVSGAWDSALLGPVAEVNEQMLECLRQMAADAVTNAAATTTAASDAVHTAPAAGDAAAR